MIRPEAPPVRVRGALPPTGTRFRSFRSPIISCGPRKDTLVGAKPKLLSGGNPQIGKADGDAPVQAYIAAMPGPKREVGRRLDALIVSTVPGVRKAVR